MSLDLLVNIIAWVNPLCAVGLIIAGSLGAKVAERVFLGLWAGTLATFLTACIVRMVS